MKKKLTLSRNTIRRLTDLSGVSGAASLPIPPPPPSFGPFGQTCYSCYPTCFESCHCPPWETQVTCTTCNC